MLRDFQTTIFNLYTNGKFRQLFFENPEEALGGRDLTARERTALVEIDIKALSLFAQSLSRKRRRTAERVLARTPRAVVSSGFYLNGPVLFLKNGGMARQNLSNGAYEIFKNIAGKIETKTLLRACLTTERCAVRDCVELLGIVWKDNLAGRPTIHL